MFFVAGMIWIIPGASRFVAGMTWDSGKSAKSWRFWAIR